MANWPWPPHGRLMRERRIVTWSSLVPLAVGLWAWALTVVGAVRWEDTSIGTFFLTVAVSAVLLGAVLADRPVAVGCLLAVGPFVASWTTTPRGDNDGLWVLMPMMLAGSSVVLAALAVLGDWTCLRLTGAGADGRIGARAAGIVGLVGALTAVAAIGAWRPDPWPALQSRIAEFPRPTAFGPPQFERSGDPLCDNYCLATVTATMATELDETAACEALDTALRHWPDATPPEHIPREALVEPPYIERCFFQLRTRDEGVVWAEVSSDYGATTIEVRALHTVDGVAIDPAASEG